MSSIKRRQTYLFSSTTGWTGENEIFSARRAVFSFMVLSIALKYIFICTIYTVLIWLIVAFLYDLTWAHGGSNSWESPWSLVAKWSNDQWLFCLYKSQSCRQHNMTSLCGRWHIGSSSLWMPSCESGMMQREYIQCSNNKTLKQTELIRIKLMLVFETRNYLNIS